MNMETYSEIKQGWLLNGILKKNELTMVKLLLMLQDWSLLGF